MRTLFALPAIIAVILPNILLQRIKLFDYKKEIIITSILCAIYAAKYINDDSGISSIYYYIVIPFSFHALMTITYMRKQKDSCGLALQVIVMAIISAPNALVFVLLSMRY